MQHSRRCEYEADAVAAQADSREALVHALLRLQLMAARDEYWHRHQLPARQLAEADAPASACLERWSEFGVAVFEAEAIASAWRREPGVDDSHPSIRQRAQALGFAEAPRGLPDPGSQNSAGAAWLGPQWQPLLAEWGTAKQQEMAREWTAGHLHLTAQLHCLEASADEPSVKRARLLADVGRVEQAAAMLASLVEAGSQDLALRHAVAMTELESASGLNPTAVEALESLLKADPAYAVPVRETLEAHAQRRGDAEMAERQGQLALRAMRRRGQALDAAMRTLESGELAAPELPPQALLAFDRQCESDDFVLGCWLGHCQADSVDGRSFYVHAIVLHVDFELMHARQLDEDSLVQTYLQQLRRWRDGPHQPVLARVVFLAERKLPDILNASAARRWVRR